jgi:hypothetical protein
MPQFPSLSATSMSPCIPTGLANMPAAKSQCTPHFAGQDDEILSKFLHEYKDLADGNGLTEGQKVETICHYIPCSLHNLWMTLPRYRASKWQHFQAKLEELYPNITA